MSDNADNPFVDDSEPSDAFERDTATDDMFGAPESVAAATAPEKAEAYMRIFDDGCKA